MKSNDIQNQLLSKLISNHRFWSFDMQKSVDIPDELLIEKTLIHLDIEDINLLFQAYPPKKIKQVWLERLVIQGDYYASLNRLLAWMYFGIKKPDRYLKTIENKRLKNLQ
jgi:hypothetical protein